MRSTFFTFIGLTLALVGCAMTTTAVEPRAPEVVQPETPEIDEHQAQLDELERNVWHNLDYASNLMVAHTHTLNTAAAEAGIDTNSRWQSAVWRWSRGVEDWMRGVDQLRQFAGNRARVRALLSLENHLVELENDLRNLETAYIELDDEREDVAEALGFLRGAVTGARNGVGLANIRFINLVD